MVQCPHCQTEYTPEPGYDFCDQCGNRFSDSQETGARAEGESGLAVDATPTVRASAAPDSAGPAPAGSVKVQGVGEGVVVGGDYTVNTTVQVEYCAVGFEQLVGVGVRDKFRCPKCHKDPVCNRHFNQESGMCESCVAGPRIACDMCHEQLPASQAFTCPRCKRTVGNNHLDPDKQVWCTDCRAEWGKVIDATENEKVGVTEKGTIVGEDDVVLNGKVLQTKDGESVHLFKDNIWYAKPKQWHQVKKPLLRREQQAMRRFYPDLILHSAPNDELFWEGAVKTWSGNEYEIHLRYPASFPFRPPKSYVVNPKIEQSRHIYPDGHLCMFHKDDKAWEPNTTGATMMSWISLWLHCYEVWLETGEWPRKEHDNMVITTNY